MIFKLFYQALLGPQLYRIYKTDTTEGINYSPNGMESWGDRIISFLRLVYKTTLWGSPLVCGYLLWRGYWSAAGAASLLRAAAAVGALLSAALLLRALGRVHNAQYALFLAELHRGDDGDQRRRMVGYDFEMFAWPVDFQAVSVPEAPEAGQPPPDEDGPLQLPMQLLSWTAVHTIGRRLMYPGSIGFMNALLAPALVEGRARLVEELGGRRHLLLAADGSRIDTMFVNRRRRTHLAPGAGVGNRGDKLVICCEGNAGFYEIGSTSAPLEAGYSVLGWNHPGFGGSSGVPLPASEQAAISAVIDFAQSRLDFPAEDIVLYAWSIGGYTATWAAMTYPDISAVVLDATFDDVLPLAVARMPPSWEPLVRAVCSRQLQLNNARQLRQYQGPVLLVRRTADEVITTVEHDIATNRANDLLLQLLQTRFPALVDAETTPWLQRWARADAAAQASLAAELGVQEEACHALLAGHVAQHSGVYPLRVGAELSGAQRAQLAVYVASRLMIDMEGTHCSPMPGAFFRLPWQLPHNGTSDFVLVTKPSAAE